jgi:hypothetical protein
VVFAPPDRGETDTLDDEASHRTLARRAMIDPDIGRLITAGVGLLFASAAWHKWRSIGEFTAVLRAYRLLPERAAGAAAVGIAALELLLAFALAVATPAPWPSLAAAAVLLGYGAAIGINLRRHRLDLDCGCAARHARRPIARWMVARNVLIAAAVACCALPWNPRPLALTDLVTVGAGLAIAALLYAAIDRLLGDVLPRAALLRGR